MNNYQWLLQMDGAERKAWFDAEHVETEEWALDGDTDALERKSADLIHEYYKPMVAELTAERDEWKSRWEIGKAQFDAILAERELYREALSQLLDTVTDGMGKVSALLDNYDEGMA